MNSLFARLKSCSTVGSQGTLCVSALIIFNLVAIACLLLVWNVKAVNNQNIALALLVVGGLSGLGCLACIVCLLLCFTWMRFSSEVRREGMFSIQTVYPTPEFQYFTNIMLDGVKQQHFDGGSRALQGSAFSMVTTAPAMSSMSGSVKLQSDVQLNASDDRASTSSMPASVMPATATRAHFPFQSYRSYREETI